MEIKVKLAEHALKPQPYDNRPKLTFVELKNYTHGQKVPHSLDGKLGEYSGQLDAKGKYPEGRGLFMTKDGTRLIEGQWKAG